MQKEALNAIQGLEIWNDQLTDIGRALQDGRLTRGDSLAERLNEIHNKIHCQPCACPLGRMKPDEYRFSLVGTQGNSRDVCSQDGSTNSVEELGQEDMPCFMEKNSGAAGLRSVHGSEKSYMKVKKGGKGRGQKTSNKFCK